jgi:thiol:disulfide interchange protein
MKRVVLFYFLILCWNAQSQKSNLWTEFADLNDSLEVKIKPIMIYIGTDWCKYCKLQEKHYFQR